MIKLIKSTFHKETQTKKALCNFLMRSSQLSIGEECVKFEEKFAEWQGSKYCVLFNTGSSANLALIQALKNLGRMNDGMKVGFSGITWATNVMPLIQLQLQPIPVDIEIETLNSSLYELKKVHQKYHLDAFFITNLLGFAHDIEAIRKYCKKENILLIEDNCESLGSVQTGKKLGNFGLASTFSFFVGHHMSAIEGGAVCTNDKHLNRELRMVRSHGWDRHLSQVDQRKLRKQYKISDFDAKYTFYDLAYNLRPTEITGFLGSQQLKFIAATTNKRQSNFKKFQKLSNSSVYFYPLTPQMDFISNFAMPVVCKSLKIKKRCIELCAERKIEIRPIVGGVMSDQPFFTKYISKKFDLPKSRLVHKQGFYFANNPELTPKEVSYIIETFSQL